MPGRRGLFRQLRDELLERLAERLFKRRVRAHGCQQLAGRHAVGNGLTELADHIGRMLAHELRAEQHAGLRISQMQQAMAQAFADVYGLPVTTITESQLDASEIEARRMRFASYDWIYGRAQPFPFSCGARYPWGEITLELQVEEGVCRDAAVYTDSMDAEFAAPLAEALRGCRFRVADLCGRVREVPACCQIADDLCALLGEQEI